MLARNAVRLSAPGPDCYNPATRGEALPEARALPKDFDAFRAVDGVNLRVEAGEVVALLGPNGAGKTTTIRMLASLLAPTRGEARIAGYDAALQPQQRHRRVGLLTEPHGLYPRMGAEEFLLFFQTWFPNHPPLHLRPAPALLRQFDLA